MTDQRVTITPGDLNDDMKKVAKEIGMEATLKLIRTFGGQAIYFQTIERASRKIRDQMIRLDYDGSNYRELSQKYRLSVRWIREIVNPKSDDQTGNSGPGVS